MDQSSAKIFLSEHRGLVTTNAFSSSRTFSHGSYQDENKAPFGHLNWLNDDTLAGNQQLEITVQEPTHVILLPITGDLFYERDGEDNDASEVNVGQVKYLYLTSASKVTIINPYETEQINFMQIGLKQSALKNTSHSSAFTFEMNRNKLTVITPPEFREQSGFELNIGQFDGRAEVLKPTQGSGSKFFCFVISGAFEINGRLLHPRDGLALWDISELDIEALSNDATLLTLELMEFSIGYSTSH